MSTSVSLFISPLVIGLCRRKSTRLTAVMGGLITALGCLFTSFASQFHQLFFSYGMMIGKICKYIFFVHRLVFAYFSIHLHMLFLFYSYLLDMCNTFDRKHILFSNSQLLNYGLYDYILLKL